MVRAHVHVHVHSWTPRAGLTLGRVFVRISGHIEQKHCIDHWVHRRRHHMSMCECVYLRACVVGLYMYWYDADGANVVACR